MQETNSNNTFTWKDLFLSCIAHWKWFILSGIVCLSAAFYKIASSNKTYESNASVLIKTEDKSASMRLARDAFNMMGFGNMGSNVHNEMLVFSSPTLMTKVVEELRLHEVFSMREGLRKVELYKTEPLHVVYENPGALPMILRMEIKIVGQDEYVLKQIQAGKEKYKEAIHVTANRFVETPIGKLMIYPSDHFTSEMIGKSLHYLRTPPFVMSERYAAALNVAMPDREASVINLSIRDASIAKTMDLLVTLIDTYNEDWETNQNAKIKSIAEMVNRRIEITLSELNEAEADISTYMSKNLVVDFHEASSTYFSENLELDKRILDSRTQVNIAKAMLASLKENEYLSLPANSGMVDNVIVEQIRIYNQMVLERKKLIANSSSDNAKVVEMTQSLLLISEGIDKSLTGMIDNMNLVIASLEKQKRESQSLLANTPIEARRLANVQREQKLKEELYLFLLEKREENDLSLSFASDNSRIIVAPHSTMLPVAPNVRLTILAAIIASFALPIALILLLVLLDTTVHTKKDLEEIKTSYLGEIPLVEEQKRWKYIPRWLQNVPWKKKEDKYEVLIKKNSRNIINESFRILRTKLDFMNKSGQNKVFVITSIQPGSGKSFISMNLAASYALKGSRVLVIDMDLRRATASKYVPKSKHAKGIADYLSEDGNQYDGIIIKDGIVEGLDMIPVGTMPPNPAELILSDRLSNLLDELRQQYDYIFLDCPPIDIVAESGEIARYADMALFVVRAGLFEKALLPEIDELYNKKVFNNMVVMLNAVNESSHYGYGKYGKYGYGKYGKYGYGKYGYSSYHSYYNEKE